MNKYLLAIIIIIPVLVFGFSGGEGTKEDPYQVRRRFLRRPEAIFIRIHHRAHQDGHSHRGRREAKERRVSI